MCALVGLLDDDDPALFASVRDELERLGRRAHPALERAATGENARLRSRARAILAADERRHVLRRLVRVACSDSIDLERAFLVLGGLDRPGLDGRPYMRALDAMGAEVRRRLRGEPDDFSRPMALSQYLGNELGYIGCEVGYDHPDNVHLHRTIERKRGMPLTLTALYLFVGRRAGIRAAALALPGHVLLRLYAGRRSMIVDPFHGGRLRTRADCVSYLAQHGLVPRPEWFRNATDEMLFQRHLRNLMNSMQVRGLTRRTRELHAIDRVLTRIHGRRTQRT